MGGASNTLVFASQLRSEVLATEQPHVGEKIGSYNREFANKTRKKMDKLLGEHGEKLSAEVLKQVEAGLDLHIHTEPRMPLSQLSEWLAEFDASRYVLEVSSGRRVHM